MEKFLCFGILITVSCMSLTEGRLGLRRRSLFDDPFFLRPWTTFDMMTKDFDDHFTSDPFFNDDDFENFFDQPVLKPSSQSCKKAEKHETQQSSCKKTTKTEDKDLTIPQLAARVVKNDDKQFNFAMNLKGFERNEISVKVEDDFLKISGKKGCKDENKKCSERSFFRYQYLLPKHSDLTKVKASFSKDGYLIVDVPKLQKLTDESGGLQIEELDEEYVTKLKGDATKEQIKKEQVKTEDDDDVTVEAIPPNES